jgi:PIN domain nuclease of toxin-antitoxin system
LRLLLDTHIWVWSLQDIGRLGAGVRQAMRNPENERWLSPISVWEVLILHEKGRLHLGGDLRDWVAKSTAPFLEAPLTHEIVRVSRDLPLPHRDPADRFLAATALVLDLTLVTADANLLGLGEIATLGNR